MKNKKTTLFIFSPYECSALEEYLEKMALKGWRLVSIKKPFLKFKKIEPKKLKFSVDIFSKLSIFDHRDSEKALDYREYCEAAGWKYVCQLDKIQVFYTENYDKTIDIKTDEREKFKAIFKASLSEVGKLISLIIFTIMYSSIQILTNITNIITSNAVLVALLLVIAAVTYNLISIISFFKWSIKAKKILKYNGYVEYNTYEQLKRKNFIIKLYAILLGMVLPLFIIFDKNGDRVINITMTITAVVVGIIFKGIQYFKDNKRFSKRKNIAFRIGAEVLTVVITVAFFIGMGVLIISRIDKQKNVRDNVNLRVTDFEYKESENNLITYRNSSIIAENFNYSYSEFTNSPLLEYTIFHSNYKLIVKAQETWLKNWLKRFNLGTIDTNLPEEIKVYADEYRTRYIIVSDYKVVEMYNRMKIDNDEFLDRVYEKLLKEN